MFRLAPGANPGEARAERGGDAGESDQRGGTSVARGGRSCRARVARPPRAPGDGHRATLGRQPRGRGGRLPARDRDPAHQGPQHRPRRSGALAEDRGEARGVRRPPPARAPFAGHRRRRRGGSRRRRRLHPRAGRPLRAIAPGRGGHERAQAAGGARAAAQGRGLLLPRDLRDHRMDVHQGEPLPDRGAARLRRAGAGHPGRRRVRPPGAGAVRAGGRRGERAGPGRAAAAPEDVPGLPRAAARVPRRAPPGGRARAAGGARGLRRRRRRRAARPVRVAGRRGPAQDGGARRARARGGGAGHRAEGRRVAASAAAVAGGGAAVEQIDRARGSRPGHRPPSARSRCDPRPRRCRAGGRAPAPRPGASVARRACTRRARPRPAAPPAPAQEFDPVAAAAAAGRRRPPPRPGPPTPPSPPAAERGGGGGGGGRASSPPSGRAPKRCLFRPRGGRNTRRIADRVARRRVSAPTAGRRARPTPGGTDSCPPAWTGRPWSSASPSAATPHGP